MRTFRRGTVAREQADGRPYLKIQCGAESLYVVFDRPGVDDVGIQLTEVALIADRPAEREGQISSGMYAGQITLGHLDRLGNGNRATAEPSPNRWSAFGERGPKTKHARAEANRAARQAVEDETNWREGAQIDSELISTFRG